MKTKISFIFIALLFCVACSSKAATDLINNDIYQVTIRHSGNGVLYSTTDKVIIHDLWEKLNSVSYIFTSPPDVVGGSALRIYDEQNQQIATLVNYEKIYLMVGDKNYRSEKSVELKNIYDAIITEQNKVKE